MRKFLTLILLFGTALGVVSCGGLEVEEEEEEDYEEETLQSQGWHFQGRNCLACHNVDLKGEKHLLVAGTLFRSSNVGNPDDMASVCEGELYIQLLDSSYNVVYDSRNYRDPNSKGYKGKGNLFILKRLLSDITGEYYLRIIDSNGTTLAQSTTLHTFTSIFGFDPRQNPADASNRFSCNACHRYPNPEGGAPGFLYPNVNPCR